MGAPEDIERASRLTLTVNMEERILRDVTTPKKKKKKKKKTPFHASYGLYLVASETKVLIICMYLSILIQLLSHYEPQLCHQTHPPVR